MVFGGRLGRAIYSSFSNVKVEQQSAEAPSLLESTELIVGMMGIKGSHRNRDISPVALRIPTQEIPLPASHPHRCIMRCKLPERLSPKEHEFCQSRMIEDNQVGRKRSDS
jgi:hypothetical protein